MGETRRAADGHAAAAICKVPRLQSAKLLQSAKWRERLVYIIAQLGTANRLEALLRRCPHLVGTSSSVYSSALHCTARSGNLGCALVLLQHGCGPNVRNSRSGRTIAHIACEHGHHQYLEGIINAGYDVDLNAQANETPAHAAVHHPAALQFLIDRGAYFSVVTDMKGTPATWAASEGAAESLRILLAAGADPGGLAVAAYNRPACLDVLSDAGVDLDAVDCSGETAAHSASRQGRLESLRTLHKHGADMFALSREEKTPEQLAARSGFTECVEFLAGLC
jgi:ankyrin repeat protein